MLDKAVYSAFESTLNSPIVSYRIGRSQDRDVRNELECSRVSRDLGHEITTALYELQSILITTCTDSHFLFEDGWCSILVRQ